MSRRTRATLKSKYWQTYFNSYQHCFQCGKNLVTKYVKEEKMRRKICSVCSTISYINPKVVAGLIPVMPDGRIALLKRSIEPAIGKWTYPAGFMEMGEDVSEAAARETFEEINAKVKVTDFLGVYSYADAGVVTIVYIGKVLRGQKPHAGEEAQDVRLFKKSEIPWKQLAFRSTVHALKDWCRGEAVPRPITSVT